CEDPMAARSRRVRDEAHAAGVVLVFRVVQRPAHVDRLERLGGEARRQGNGEAISHRRKTLLYCKLAARAANEKAMPQTPFRRCSKPLPRRRDACAEPATTG